MVPTAAASARIHDSSELANTAPAIAMRTEPITRTRRLPQRSARLASRIVITAPPASATLNSVPISADDSPSDARYRPSTTERNP